MYGKSNAVLKDNDGFCYVTYKGKKKKNSKQVFCSSSSGLMQNFDTVISNMEEEVKHSDFIVKFKDDIYNVLQEWDLGHILTHDSSINSSDTNCSRDTADGQEIDIICYGLGQFSSCIIARYQLGFLLVLKQILHSADVYIYDPQFSVEETSFLSKLNLNVLNINEEAKRALKRKSVCFMPHCDLPLYNNFLWANWSIKNLSELAIIGNSFQSYEMNDAKRQLKEKAKYVYLANQFVTEIRMPNVFRFADIFNDLSIHYFKSTSLSLVDSYVWTDLEEPEYSDDDIIKNI